MRAAVVGTGWGRVHISALQELGVDVVAVCGTDPGHTRAVAHEHGIPAALVGVDDLKGLHLDLITIASPTALHADMVTALGPTPLLCDKPAVGVEVPVSQLRPPTGPVWVNYAFPFLTTVRQADAALASGIGGIGPVDTVEVHSDYDLGDLVSEERSAWQWLSDVASHPWSWAVARFGLPTGNALSTTVTGEAHDGRAALNYSSAAGVAVSVSAAPNPGLAGLRHSVRVRGANGELTFGGQFRLGDQWAFGPVRINGNALSATDLQGVSPIGAEGDAEGDPPQGDAWHRANVAAIGAVVELVGAGHSTATAGTTGAPDDPEVNRIPRHRAPEPFTWSEALAMDACVQAAANHGR